MDVFRAARSILAESIWWDASGAIEWCDITSGLLRRSPIDAPVDGSADRVLEFPPPVSAFQPTADGGYVLALGDTVAVCDGDGAGLRTIATVSHRHPGIRFNEAKCDPFGRFVVGSMDVTTGDPDGAIYAIEPDGRCTTLIGGIGVANGFEWSDDGDRMYFTDTAASTIFVAEYDGRELRGVEPFVVGMASDGLARDADGGFWNGINDIGVVVRWDADGVKTDEVDVPAGHVTSVAFGGPDLSTLFIATAREKLTEAELEAQPLTGSIFSLQTGTRGFPVNRFGAESH